MHANAALLTRLFEALNRHDPEAMSDCYDARARFRDIAFDLQGREAIRGMWRMICGGDIEVEVLQVEADDEKGCARLVDKYSFGLFKWPVENRIESRFRFRHGRIVQQDDDCDPRPWARQALGKGPFGALAGRSRRLRSVLARTKLGLWLLFHPERRGKQPFRRPNGP